MDKPYMWVIDDTHKRCYFFVSTKNAPERIAGIKSHMESIDNIPDEWWENKEILSNGFYTSNNGKDYRKVEITDKKL